MSAPGLPFTHRLVDGGILTWGAEDLVVEARAPDVGAAVCLESGGRLAFRRVLSVDGTSLRLRADVAPFEDAWSGPIVGTVRPRLIDRLASVDAERFTRNNWRLALVAAQTMAARRRLARTRRVALTTRTLEDADWPEVRAFWREACGEELLAAAPGRQRVVGLFDGDVLAGANIHLVFGTTSYSAFTMVDRRYRGTGGGTKMIDHAVRNARLEGLASIYVHINARNLPSIGAYVRAGFRRRGWWSDAADPMAAAERQWIVFEIDLTRPTSP